jgi:hypothetical protein
VEHRVSRSRHNGRSGPLSQATLAGTPIFITALVAAIAFAWLRRELLARPSLDFDALYADAGARDRLDPQLTREVLKGLGSALEIDPGKLRLTDAVDALWDMQPQAGFHQRATFEDWLVKRFPRLPDTTPAATIADLVAALQRLPMVR